MAFSSQVQAYVRGAVSCGGSVENAAIENSTAVFTKRVYRDAWNRNIGVRFLFGTCDCGVRVQTPLRREAKRIIKKRTLVKRIAKTRNHTLPP